MEWSKKQYNQQYENWMPWIEDVRCFSRININLLTYHVERSLLLHQGQQGFIRY